jgi:hypothetical protein
MATGSYIRAAQQAADGKREPVVLLRVEDVATIERIYTTKEDWDGSAELLNIETEDILGSALNYFTEDMKVFGGDWEYPYGYGVEPKESGFVYRLKGSFHQYSPGGKRDWFGSYEYSFTIPSSVLFQRAQFNVNPGPILESKTINVKQAIIIEESTNQLYPDYYYCTAYLYLDNNANTFLLGGVDENSDTWFWLCNSPLLIDTKFVPTATSIIKTSTIDFEASPADPVLFSVDDIKSAGVSITYEAFADDFSPPTTSRGVIVDGDAIGSVGYRYYRILATFSSSNGAVGELAEIVLSGGDQTSRLFSTHRDLPTVGAAPLLPMNPVGTLSSKIELDKPTSVGEIGVKMLWTKEVGDLIATGYLRNKAVQVKHGFVGLAESEFETIFTGSWANYTADHRKMEISVSTQNVLRRFMKVKLPRETFNASGVKSTVPLVFSADNAVQVILDLVDELGIPDRYIDRTTIEGLRDGALAGSEYNVTRTLTTPVEAWKLVHELATLCGCFVVVLPSGKMTLTQYDLHATPAATFDARHVDFDAIDGGQDALFTRQLIYYDPNVADPKEEEEDYDKGYLLINAGSETAYDESSEHRWFDLWGASVPVLTALADRWDRWHATPRFKITCKNAGLRHIAVLEGQIVNVVGLRVPCEDTNWAQASEFKALVMKRSIDPTKCVMSFDLMQITDAFTGYTSGFSAGFR